MQKPTQNAPREKSFHTIKGNGHQYTDIIIKLMEGVTGLESVEKQYIMIENKIKQSIMSKVQSY